MKLRCLMAVLLVGVFAWVACQKDNPTVPDLVLPEAASTPVPVEVEPQIITAPQATPGELPLWVKCNQATGVCTFGTDKPRPVDAVCTYPGQNHPIWGTWESVVNDGDTVNAVDICTEVPGVDEERCVPITKPVQVDFHGMGRHIGHLGPLYNLTFPATLSPEECEECVEFERPEITREFENGEWGECEETPNRPAECKRVRPVTVTITRTWNCKDPEIVVQEKRQSEPCVCTNECDLPTFFGKSTGDECEEVCIAPEEITLSWEGPGDPATECAAFGDYVPAGDHNPLFWICKAGTDREAWLTFPDGDTCRNGKDVSHVRACVCEDDD